MSTDRDTTRIVRSWLEEGVTALPDRVLDAVLDQVPATPQRRRLAPVRRSLDMHPTFKFAMAAAAVLIAAVVGYSAFGLPGPGGQPTPGPTASAPQGVDYDLQPMGDLAPGTYGLDSVGPFHVRFTIPVAGWVKNIVPRAVWSDDSEARLGFGTPPYLYSDPCHWNTSPHATLGPTVADLATALDALPGLESTATAATVSGFQGTLVEITVSADQTACDTGEMFLYDDVPLEPGRHRIWVIDVAGSRLYINAVDRTGATAADRAQLQQIVDSIGIDVR